MRNKLNIFIVLCSLFLSVCFSSLAPAQSTNQTFPTPVTTNEINGIIKARDIGDARLTGYFYAFNGTQGDIFVNVVTKNFNGDIDIFTVEGLKSLTKIVIYADSSSNETGRLIYLRKPEKLLLRVEGRSPNDDPATFRIKFAGSFVAVEGGTESEAPEMPEIKAENDSGVRVNSVGTIIEVIPKPKPTPKETVAKVEPPVKKDVEPEKTDKPEEEKKPEKIRVLVSENIPPSKKPEDTPKKEVKKPVRKPPVKPAPKKVDEDVAKDAGTPPAEKPAATAKTPKRPKVTPPKPPPAPDPLESVRLVILFKDGKKIERPMSEVIRFNVDKGVLTVVLKDGTMVKHSILDVEKVTIE